ncbi:hypothetical protein [Oscillibacter sp.]|nr:hypothetical protein [Oscillibacter sp.]MDD3347089.1 hypothetical protein [Oscillibacter sp.]
MLEFLIVAGLGVWLIWALRACRHSGGGCGGSCDGCCKSCQNRR